MNSFFLRWAFGSVSHISAVEHLCLCVQDVLSAEFMHRLKSLLQRAYSLQEEFEGVLCVSEPSSHGDSQGESLVRRSVFSAINAVFRNALQ